MVDCYNFKQVECKIGDYDIKFNC